MSTNPSGDTPLVVGVLALQGDVREHEAVLRGLGVEVVQVRTPDDLERVEAIVIPGGESTTLQMLMELSQLTEPLRARLECGMPALGTCAGMIALSTNVLDGRADQHPLGAIDITVRRNAFGRQLESFESILDVKGIDGPVTAVFIRAPVVEEVGEGVDVLAEVTFSDGKSRPVVCKQGAVLVIAFHPELAGEARLHELLIADVEASRSRS